MDTKDNVNQTLQERRSSSRAVTKIEIKFRDINAFIKSYMLNVSKGGLFIQTEEPFDLDTIVILKFTLPNDNEPIESEGRVVWTNPKGGRGYFPKGMGIQFIRMRPEDSVKIKKFVEAHFASIKADSFL